MAVKQLDRFLETLQILTSCQFGEVTFEGVIEMKTVIGFGIYKTTQLPIETDR